MNSMKEYTDTDQIVLMKRKKIDFDRCFRQSSKLKNKRGAFSTTAMVEKANNKSSNTFGGFKDSYGVIIPESSNTYGEKK